MKRRTLCSLAAVICLSTSACRFVVHKDDVIVSLRGDDWRKNEREDVWSCVDGAASMSLRFHEVLERHPVRLHVQAKDEGVEIAIAKIGDSGAELGSYRVIDESYRYTPDRIPVLFRTNDNVRIPARCTAEFSFFARSFFADGEPEVGEKVEFDIRLTHGTTTKFVPVRMSVDDTRGDSGFELIGH